MIAHLLRLLALVLLLAGPAAAQEAPGPDYKDFEAAAGQAETALADDTVPDARLSELRAQMVKWRATFTDAQSANSDQISTLRQQIAALGPAPAEGETEDPTISKRRDELNATLARLQAPVLSATEAATRADSLIRNIDRMTRERQADKLLRLSPSPANPVHWPAAVSLFRWMGAWIYDETKWRFAQPVNFDALRDNAPLIAVLVLLALVLLARGSHWMAWLTEWLLNKTAMRGRGVILGLVSLGHVVLPVLGALMLAVALDASSLFGPILTELFVLVPVLLFTILAAHWLGVRIFPRRVDDESTVAFSEAGRTEGRFHALMLGTALALNQLVTVWIAPRAENYLGGAGNIAADKAQAVAERADAALAVLQAPLQVFAALALFRMGQLIRRQVRARQAESDEDAFRLRLLGLLGAATMAVAMVAPVLGLIGYVSAADALLWPMIVTLGLLAAVAVLQGFVAELYVIVARSDAAGRDGLVPVLAGFLLALASLPLLALIWGVRVDDLTEIWTSFRSGVSMGGVRISPAVFLTFAAVFAAGYAITRGLQGALRASILPKTRIDKGGQNAIVSGTGYIGIFVAALAAISAAGIDLSSLAIVAGALSVGIGFGLQNIVSNFVSGIILLIERPISEGDWIEVGTQMGTVKAISVRSTVIETFDRTEVIVPNSDLIAGQVTNWTRANMTGRLIALVGVAYGTDTRRVESILLEIAHAQPLVMMNPEPFVVFAGFGADSLDFELRMILSDVNFKLRVQSEINHQIAARFAAEGIEIPFAQRDIWLRNPEALPGAAPRRRPPAAAKAAKAAAAPPAPVPEPVPPKHPPETGEGMADNDGLETGEADGGGDGGR